MLCWGNHTNLSIRHMVINHFIWNELKFGFLSHRLTYSWNLNWMSTQSPRTDMRAIFHQLRHRRQFNAIRFQTECVGSMCNVGKWKFKSMVFSVYVYMFNSMKITIDLCFCFNGLWFLNTHRRYTINMFLFSSFISEVFQYFRINWWAMVHV